MMSTYFFPKISRIFFIPFAEMTPVMPKCAEFGQNRKYEKIHKMLLGKGTKFQRASANGSGVIKNNP